MNYSTRKGVLKGTSAILAASAATFAAAVVVTMSKPAFAAADDYRFEVAQVASAGPGRSDVTVRLVAGPHTLQVSGKVPGATRIERTFNSSVKFWRERKVRGEDKVVTGVVTFTAL